MSAVDPSPPSWVSLSQAANEIANGRYRYQLGDSDAAISNAIRTGEIPLRGRPKGELALKRIDTFDLRQAEVIIALCELNPGRSNSSKGERVNFTDVQVDFVKLIKYVAENLCERPLIGAKQEKAAEQAFRLWLLRRVHRQERPVKKRLYDDINETSHELYDVCGKRKLSERAMFQIWANEAPGDWKLPGAPMKRQSQR